MIVNKEQENEFYELAEQYVSVLHYMNLFIENNDLDYDEIWNKANQMYDEDLSICDADN